MELIRKIQKLIRRHVDFALSSVHTHLPAQVISYDSGDNTVVVQPCIKVMRTGDPDNDTIELPVIEDVPVSLLGSGKCLLTVAPQAGSYGVLHVAERSLERWILEGGIVEPGSVRKFDISDCFFVPGIYPTVSDGDNGKLQAAVATDRIELRTRSGDTTVSVLDNDSIVIETTGQVSVNGSETVIQGGSDWAVQYTALKSAFDTLKNDFNNFVTLTYNLHNHPTAPVGPVSIPSVVGTSTTADMTSSKISDVRLP